MAALRPVPCPSMISTTQRVVLTLVRSNSGRTHPGCLSESANPFFTLPPMAQTLIPVQAGRATDAEHVQTIRFVVREDVHE